MPERGAVLRSAAADRARRRGHATGRPAIAVLGFAADEGDRHLGDGMAEDLATELGRFRELDVIAPATALAYRASALPPERVGAELGTTYVLSGRLRPAGERLRISVRLVETLNERQLWAERYDCARGEVFDIQDEVVRRIVGTVIGQIEGARLEAARRQRPNDLAAYDLWLRGWSALKRPDLAALADARGCFQAAVARDPQFARAYVGLAMAYLNEWACFSWNHWFFLRQEALDLAQKAVELDERDHRAHCVLGVARLYGRDYEGARRQLLRALELNPNDADVLAHAAAAMALIGEPGLAVEAGRSALRLAPHHPEWYTAFAGIALFSARLHDEAIATMAPAPEALCNTPAFIAAAYAHLGELEACPGHRETVHRHHRRQLARGLFPKGTSCIDWLLAMDPVPAAGRCRALRRRSAQGGLQMIGRRQDPAAEDAAKRDDQDGRPEVPQKDQQGRIDLVHDRHGRGRDAGGRETAHDRDRRRVEPGGVAQHRDQNEPRRQAHQHEGPQALERAAEADAIGADADPAGQAAVADRREPQRDRRDGQKQPRTRAVGQAELERGQRRQDRGQQRAGERGDKLRLAQAQGEVGTGAVQRRQRGQHESREQQPQAGAQERRPEASHRRRAGA